MTPEVTETEGADRSGRIYVALVLAWLGVLVCFLLIRQAETGTGLCGPGTGCNQVLSSRFARPGGISLSQIGAFFYATTFGLLLVELALPPGRARRLGLTLVLAASLAGLIGSAALMIIQFAVLRAFCPLCTISAGVMTALCLVAWSLRNHPDWSANPGAAVALLIVCVTSGWMIGGPSSRGSFGAVPVAKIDGHVITRKALDDAMQFTKYDVQRQIYNVELERLQEKIDEYLLKSEAARRKVTVPMLLEKEVLGKVDVTEAELEQWIAARPDGQTIDAEKTRAFLVERREFARKKFLTSLKAGHDIRILLRPPLPPLLQIDPEKTKIRGPESAAVKLLVFSDFDCPFCREMAAHLENVRKKFPQDVSIAFHYYPMEEHPRSWDAAAAAECASEQGKFWEYHDWLFQHGGRLADSDLLRGAQIAGLDLEKFRSCLSSGRAAELVRKRYDEGSAAGIYGTPLLFLNGKLVDPSRYDDLAEVVKTALTSEKKQTSTREP